MFPTSKQDDCQSKNKVQQYSSVLQTEVHFDFLKLINYEENLKIQH